MNRAINKNYWIIWGCATALLIAVRVLFGNSLSENALFYIFCLYMVPLWLWIMYLNYRKGRDLTGYLEKEHHYKWEEITHVPFLGSGGFNSFKSLPFIFSKDYLNDDNVKELKQNYIHFMKFAIFVFLTIPLVFLLVMVSWQR